jgi:methyltransferase (TIGR00027 family)
MNNLQAAVQPTLAGRTAEFDRQVRAAVEAGCKQYVILGAGYDTRALRLDLPKDVQIFEIDQPGVQERKRAKLSSIPGLSLPSSVHFVPVDFSTESIAMLLKHPAYDPTVPTVFTLEGVTQYISKEATASTLASAAELSGPGSRFLASYVPQELWDSPEKCGVDAGQFSTFLWQVATIAGEPWISGWGAPELAAQMHAHGFMVERDVSLRDLNKDFFEPAGRPIPEQHQVILERCATAIKNSDGHAD